MDSINTVFCTNPNAGVYEYACQRGHAYTDRVALWFYEKKMTFRQLFTYIDYAADHLYQLGVRQGTVVTIHLPNCPQAVIAFYAAAKLGAICSMVHALTPCDALRENINFTESQFLITHRLDCLGIVENGILVDISHYMGFGARLLYRLKNKTETKQSVAVFEAWERPCAQQAVFPQENTLGPKCAVYLHSSGTTGTPKTILLSHSALNNCVANTADFFEDGDMANQVSLGVLPLFHGFGLAMDVHRNISHGSQLVLVPRWKASTAVKLIKKHKVTLMVGVPTMYYALLREPNFKGKKISQLSKCYVGGDTVSPELIDAFEARLGGGHRMFAGFGLTEATTTNCVNSYLHYKAGSCGYPVRNTTVAVLSDTGTLSNQGEGELLISSPTMMMGYLKNDEATNAAMYNANGKQWIRTGDCAQIDEEGYIHFKRRIKNVIIRNGYNIYPDQVESVIRNVPQVTDVCVVGVLDEVLHTQRVRAVVILETEADQTVAKAAIQKECLRMLPRYSVPGEVVFIPAFPKNVMGKIDRKELSQP